MKQSWKLSTLIIVFLLVLGGLSAWSWYRSQDQKLTAKPEELAVAASYQPEQSIIGMRASIGFGNIRHALSKLTSEPYKESGSDSWKYQTKLKTKGLPNCHFEGIKLYCTDTWIIINGPKISIGYRYSYTVQRKGKISVRKNQERVRITVPISFHGNAGLRGDGAKVLKLNKKNFDGSLTAFLDVGFDLDENWCPIAKLDVSHRWNSKARIEIIDNIYISVSGKADELIADLKSDAEKQLAKALDCKNFRNRISPFWRAYSFPIQLLDGEPTFINLAPTSIAFSGIKTEDDRLGLTIRLTASTSLGPVALDPRPAPLPTLERIDWTPGQIALEVPIGVSFAQLKNVAREELLREPFESQTLAGNISIKIHDIDIYPSGEEIAVGLEFSADIPGRIFSTSGDVYLVAKPSVAPSGTEIFLANVGFSRALDNELWEVLSALFEEKIKKLIEEKIRYDFSKEVSEIEETIFEKLTDSTIMKGLKVTAEHPRVTVKTIYPAADLLFVVVRVETSIDAVIGTDLLSKP